MNPAAKWLLDLYKGSGLTKQKFAKRCGMCAIQISRWERGEQDPYPSSIIKAGAAFGVEPPEEIIEAAEEAGRRWQAAAGGRRVKKAPQVPIAEQKGIDVPNKDKEKASRFQYDGKPREFCKKNRCEWIGSDGKCHLPSCLNL